jgi:hypothetical protein
MSVTDNFIKPKNKFTNKDIECIYFDYIIYKMNTNTNAIQYLSMIMKGESLKIDYVLSMVEIINNSYGSAKDVAIVLEEIFKHEKSAKILIAVQVLEYLVKNGNRNFHEAANKESFQKSILGLLKRVMLNLFSKEEKWASLRSSDRTQKIGRALSRAFCTSFSCGTTHSS